VDGVSISSTLNNKISRRRVSSCYTLHVKHWKSNTYTYTTSITYTYTNSASVSYLTLKTKVRGGEARHVMASHVNGSVSLYDMEDLRSVWKGLFQLYGWMLMVLLWVSFVF
jgi:hypothetical protein